MEELGFGPLDLVDSFSVSMAGVLPSAFVQACLGCNLPGRL